MELESSRDDLLDYRNCFTFTIQSRTRQFSYSVPPKPACGILLNQRTVSAPKREISRNEGRNLIIKGII